MILLQIWEHRAIILATAVAGLLAVIVHQHDEIVRLEAEAEFTASQKPKVSESSEKKVETTTRKGPKKVTKTFAPPTPGSCEPVLIAVVTEEGPAEIEKKEEAVKAREEVPVCPAPRKEPRWLLGGSFNPRQGKEQMIHVGVSPSRNLDLTYGHSVNGPERHDIRAMIRF